jgi:hypothetical protein
MKRGAVASSRFDQTEWLCDTAVVAAKGFWSATTQFRLPASLREHKPPRISDQPSPPARWTASHDLEFTPWRRLSWSSIEMHTHINVCYTASSRRGGDASLTPFHHSSSHITSFTSIATIATCWSIPFRIYFILLCTSCNLVTAIMHRIRSMRPWGSLCNPQFSGPASQLREAFLTRSLHRLRLP